MLRCWSGKRQLCPTHLLKEIIVSLQFRSELLDGINRIRCRISNERLPHPGVKEIHHCPPLDTPNINGSYAKASRPRRSTRAPGVTSKQSPKNSPIGIARVPNSFGSPVTSYEHSKQADDSLIDGEQQCDHLGHTKQKYERP